MFAELLKAIKQKVYVKGSKGKTGYYAFRKKGKAPKKGRYYTPDYVINVPFPPLAHAAELWTEKAKEVFHDMGKKEGYKDVMMPHFNEIHKRVLEDPRYKVPSKKEKNQIHTLNSIIKNPPANVEVPEVWADVVERHLGKYGRKLTQEEIDSEMSGIMAHYQASLKAHSTDYKRQAKELAADKKYHPTEKQYFNSALNSMVDFFNKKKINPANLDGKDRRNAFNDFYKEYDLYEDRSHAQHLNKEIEKIVLKHFKARSLKKSLDDIWEILG